jgi:Putative  PD-(D/E)XK family member, (DUF4420)
VQSTVSVAIWTTMASLRERWAELRGTTGAITGGGYRLRLMETRGDIRVYAALAESSLAQAVVVEMPKEVRPRGEVAAMTKAFEAVIADFGGLSPGRIGVAVVLRDGAFEDLFAILGDEIISTVRQAPGAREAARSIWRCIARWRRFIERGRGGLSDEEVRGLIGELVVLARCVVRLGPRVAVSGWTGPEDALRDFELPDASIEVKTYQSDSGAAVRINDPQQLDGEGIRPVYLAAVRLARMESKGKPLPEFVTRAGELIADMPEAVDAFEQRLAAYGYLPVHASAYTDHFVAEKVALYRVRSEFPRLRASDVPPGVVDVHFSLQLAALGQFEVDPEAIIGAPTSKLEGTE